MLSLAKKEQNSQQDANICYICGKKFVKNLAADKNHRKARDHYHYTGKDRGATHSICNLRFNIPNEILVDFNNG